MRVTLVFRQGSFSREFPCESIDHAFARVGEYLNQDGCSDFRIADQNGRIVHDDGSVRRTYMRLARAPARRQEASVRELRNR